MADEKRLFDKPMDELREEFVRNRFGQTDVYGRWYIEDWLAKQCIRQSPDDIVWSEIIRRCSFVSNAIGKAPLARLRTYATPIHAAENHGTLTLAKESPLYRDVQQAQQLVPFAALFSHGGATVYYDHASPAVVLVKDQHGKQRAYVVCLGSDGNIPKFIVRHFRARPLFTKGAVADVIFAEWLRKGPKWEKARQFLCDAFAEEVKRERAKAEADFDTAVAVSSDGTKIVHADWVVVWNPTERRQTRPADIPSPVDIRPAQAFVGNPICRTESCHRWRDAFVPSHRSDWENAADGPCSDPIRIGNLLREAWDEWRWANQGQWLLDVEIPSERRTIRVFITPNTECPVPLPGDSFSVMI